MRDNGPRKLSPHQLRVLEAVEREDVTWRNSGRGTSFRLWTGERDYVLVTPYAKALMAMGLVRRGLSSYSGALRGPVELTDGGRRVLAGAPRIDEPRR